MPLRLSVGVSRKLGLPEYSSVGATCSLDLELEDGLLRDTAAFHAEVRDAFVAAHRAVDDELAWLRPRAEPGPAPSVEGHGGRNGSHPTDGRAAPGTEAGRAGPPRPATTSQVQAIVTIARRQRADLEGLLRELGVTRAEDLSLADASRLIDQLKAAGRA